MKTCPCLILPFLAGALAASLHATTITFDSASDYTNNFTPAFSSGNAVVWESPGNLKKADNNTSGGSSSTVLYNGAAGANFTLKMDLTFDTSLNNYTGGSLSGGFVTQISGNTGYLSVFRFTSTTTADFRVFEGFNASTGTVGTQVGTTLTFTRSSGAFAENSPYTFQLDVLNTGTSISFSGSVLSPSQTVLGSFATVTDSSPTNAGASTVGFRLGVNQLDISRMDNFSLVTAAIPEPSSAALLGGAGALALACRTRRRRRQPCVLTS